MHRKSTPSLTLSILLVACLATASAGAAGTPGSVEVDRWKSSGKADSAIIARIHAAYAEAELDAAPKPSRRALKAGSGSPVGTWVVDVTSPDLEPFRALQTFHADHTFTETSDLFATLTEGPAHGTWRRKRSELLLTFQLFAFENGQPVGMIRVRNVLEVSGATMTGISVVDFIAPDGTVIPDLATAELTGERLRVLGVSPSAADGQP